MRKKIIWIIVVVFAGIIVFRIAQRLRGPARSESAIEVPAPVVTREAARSSITKFLYYTGNVKGKVQINVHPIEETGRLQKYLVREGQHVSKGDVIALVDRSIKGMEFKPAPITSPISGLVAILYLDEGASVAPQIPVAMIADVRTIVVELNIVEKDVAKIKKGGIVEVSVSAYMGEVFRGRITQISPILEPLSRTIKVEVEINNPGYKLKPGMLAEVKIVVEKHDKVIVVSEEALLEREAEKVVFIVQDDVAVEKIVRIGIESEGMVEIEEGLSDGDRVIISGNYELKDGQKVEIKEP